MTVYEAPVGASVEWYTPPHVFDRLGLTFGTDPASPGKSLVPWVPAERHFTRDDDGLNQVWTGRVWLNPPYGRDSVPFVDKLIGYRNGIVLLPARTETKMFQRAARNADAICFLRDRLHFIRPDGFQARSSFASVLIGFGSECEQAIVRADMGWTV